MKSLLRSALLALIPALALMALGSAASASTLNQNVSWTIDRAGTTTKYRVVAYGDSIYAGYNGSTTNAAKYSAPTVDAEYLSALWNADIESVRRTKSGAVASDIYTNKIVAERSYMQAASTRAVTFEMCGNDGLQARTAFKKQTGTCNYSGMDAAVASCKTYVAAAMDYINANAYSGVKVKVISNLHYPGYAADNVQSTCKDATTGATINLRDKFLPKLATMNYWMCEYARQKGFQCADNFAQYMGADYDSNSDGQVDADALRYVAGESEASYLGRITGTLKATLRDANAHFVSASSSYDYIQSDDTHPTYTGGTVTAGLFGGTTGSGAPRYTSFAGGQEPDLEPVRARTHGLGGIHLQPCVTLIATEALTFGIATQAQIPAGRRAGRDTSLGPQSGPSCCCGAARGQRVGLVPVWRRFAARSDRGGSPSPAFHPLCR
jgi:lysophospholipase L1-like esterase